MWIDVMPTSTGREEYPWCDLAGVAPKFVSNNVESVLAADTDGYHCELKLSTETFAGEVCGASVNIQRTDGSLVNNLQPYMGAFAHIVGFADDFKSVLHIHPLGPMPKPNESGGPLIDFKYRPLTPGYLRLFVQFNADGRLHVASFGIPVRTIPPRQ
jgi:hypothetical protein